MHKWLLSLFKTVRMFLCAVSFYMILVEALYIIYIIKWHKQGKSLESCVGKIFSKKKGIILCQILIMFGFLSSPFVFGKFQNTNIGSFLEKDTYREQYYVYIRNNKKQSKSYRCKADICRSDYGYNSYTDEGEETFVIQGNGYFLEKIYWDNGGYLMFTDDDWLEVTSSTRIYPGKETLVTDCHDNDYYVTLTTEKVMNSPQNTVTDKEKSSNNTNSNWQESAKKSLENRGYFD